MPFTAIIDVAVGMMVIYLVLSLICTKINEIIATSLKLRANMLQATVSQLIDDPELRQRFYEHGLIGLAGLSSTGGDPKAKPAIAATATVAAGPHPSYFDSRTFAMALLGSLDKKKALPEIGAINALVNELPAGKIKDVLVTNVATAGDDLIKLRNSVADWFDSSMDRLSGEYVRKTKIISFCVGLGLAILLNVDSFSLATAVWSDHHLQQQAVTLADKYIKGPAPAATPPTVQDSQTLPDDINNAMKYAGELRPFPVGWQVKVTWRDFPFGWPDFGSKFDLSWWVVRILGWLVTALALSLGAPFWFDLLKRMMSLRGTGAVPDTETQKTSSQPAK